MAGPTDGATPTPAEAVGDAPFYVSLSAMQTYKDCEELYYASYVLRQQPLEREIPLERGSLFHDFYLEPYYARLKRIRHPTAGAIERCFQHAMEQLNTEGRAKCQTYAQASYIAKNDELAETFIALPDIALRIAERYHRVRGAIDGLRYIPLVVERAVNMPVAPGIISRGRLDMVALDVETGRVGLWEHKTTMDVPPERIRLMDLQTLLYRRKLKFNELQGQAAIFNGQSVVPEYVLWNYLYMKEPTVPEALKPAEKTDKQTGIVTVTTKGVTRKKDMVTTWDVYAQAVWDAGDDPDKAWYDEMRERLQAVDAQGRTIEERVFFPRFEKLFLLQENLVMADYAEKAKEMQAKVAAWRAGTARPVKALNRRCSWCNRAIACMAQLVGGVDAGNGEPSYDEIVRQKFRTAEQH